MAKIPNSFKIIGGIAAVVAGAAAGTFFYLKKNKATVLKDGCFIYKFDDLNAKDDEMEEVLDGETTEQETEEAAQDVAGEVVEEVAEEPAKEKPKKAKKTKKAETESGEKKPRARKKKAE